MKLILLQSFCPASSGYGVLCVFLDFIGIGIFKDRSRYSIRYACKKIFAISLFITQACYLCASGRSIFRDISTIKLYGSFICISIIRFALWYDIYKKKATIKFFVIQFHRIRLLSGRKTRSLSFVINISLAIGISISFLSLAFHLWTLSDISYREEILTFPITIENKIIERLVKITCSLLLIILFLAHFVFTIMCSSLYYKCSELLGDFGEDIAVAQCRELHHEELIELLQKQILLYRLTLAVDRGLSFTSLLLLCSQMLNMYVALASFVNLDGRTIAASTIWICTPSLTVTPCSVIGLTLSASRIQFKYKEIQVALQNLYHSLVSRKKVEWKSLIVVKGMLETSFPIMSASGIVELKPELILSVFGSLFTYGLLVLNFK